MLGITGSREMIFKDVHTMCADTPFYMRFLVHIGVLEPVPYGFQETTETLFLPTNLANSRIWKLLYSLETHG